MSIFVNKIISLARFMTNRSSAFLSIIFFSSGKDLNPHSVVSGVRFTRHVQISNPSDEKNPAHAGTAQKNQNV